MSAATPRRAIGGPPRVELTDSVGVSHTRTQEDRDVESCRCRGGLGGWRRARQYRERDWRTGGGGSARCPAHIEQARRQTRALEAGREVCHGESTVDGRVGF